jgi:hypothetical protein
MKPMATLEMCRDVREDEVDGCFGWMRRGPMAWQIDVLRPLAVSL